MRKWCVSGFGLKLCLHMQHASANAVPNPLEALSLQQLSATQKLSVFLGAA